MQDHEGTNAGDWSAVYTDDCSRAAYQQTFQELAPVSWDVVETAQGDLLSLLIDRVEPSTGVPVLLGLSTITRDPDDDVRTKAILTTIVEDLDPKFAKTVLASLAAGWRTAAGRPIDARPELIRSEGQRAVRRLRALELPESDIAALEQLRILLRQIPATSANQL